MGTTLGEKSCSYSTNYVSFNSVMKMSIDIKALWTHNLKFQSILSNITWVLFLFVKESLATIE